MKPIIGVFAEVDEEKKSGVMAPYISAIEKSGGIPMLLPYVESDETLESFMEICQGFFFTGGADIHPMRYGEEMKETCGELQVHRDDLEFRAFEMVMRTGKPILAICRGAQLINIALGGSLYQDLPSELPTHISHRQTEPKFSPAHSVNVLADTPLWNLMQKERMTANSFHHQAVKELGRGLTLAALADDGIVEAFWMESHPYLRAYQWHPERLFEIDADNRLIFADFVGACRV